MNESITDNEGRDREFTPTTKVVIGRAHLQSTSIPRVGLWGRLQRPKI